MLSIVSKVPISTGSECEWGVSYWCQSHDTATRCGQLEYCQSIWKVIKYIAGNKIFANHFFSEFINCVILLATPMYQ